MSNRDPHDNRTAIIGLAQFAIDRVLAADEATRAQLATLAGRVIAIELRGTGRVIFLRPQAGGARLETVDPGRVDVRICGGPADFVAMARARRTGRALAAGQIEIQGDLGVAQQVQALLAGLEPDWEEILAGGIGETAAHQAGRAAGGFVRWARGTGALIAADVAEYLQRESALLPTPAARAEFGDATAALERDLDRLETRVRALLARRVRA